MLLPGPFSWTKRLLAILKSNLSPNQIAFGFALGIFAGLPPIGLHVILPCTLALFFRCSFRAFLLSFGLFELLSLVLAPSAHAVGRWLLDVDRGLDVLWRLLFHLPVVAPMGYGRYLLLGSSVMALIFAVPIFLIVRSLVVRYRVSFVERVSGWGVSRWFRERRGMAVLRWALAGGKAKYGTKTVPRGIVRYVRSEMLIGLPLVYAICYLLAAVIVPFFAGTVATSTASWIVGSEVAISDSSFSLFTGSLDLTGLTVQDPKSPNENLVEIPAIRLDASMTPLLAKRVVFDNVVIADVTLHVAREEDGTLNLDNVSSGWNVDGYLEWAARHAKDVDWLGLLRQFLRYLADVQPLAPREDPYARYRGGRSFPAYRPPFTVSRLELGRVLITLEDRLGSGGPLPPIDLFEVEVSNIAFPGQLRERPIELRFRGRFADDPDSGFELEARFEEAEQAVSLFRFSMKRIDLPRLIAFYRTTLPVDLLSGRATMTAELLLAGDVASGQVSLLLEDLEVAARPDRPLFGLSTATSDRIVLGLNRYARELPVVVGFGVGGEAEAPTLEWEAALLDIARDGLLMLGRRQLESTIEDLGFRIDRLGGVATIPLDPDYKAVRAQADEVTREFLRVSADDALGSLIEGLTDGETRDAESPLPEARQTGIGELLERLLEGNESDGS